jgi:putative ATP-dependent endonuclease of the OLD family
LTAIYFGLPKGENVQISFENSDIIFLLGQNNSGKSTILKAYEILVNPKFEPSIQDFHGHRISEPIIIEAIFGIANFGI